MNLHRRGIRAAQAFYGAALLSLLLPSRLCAQGQVQLYIDQTFVVRDNSAYCYYNASDKHFHCMNGDSTSCGGSQCTDINDSNGYGLEPAYGNISNDPEISFDQQSLVQSECYTNGSPNSTPVGDDAVTGNNICNGDVFLCTGVGYNNPGSDAVGLDMVEVEIFKFQNGSNPLDASSTPPLRTFFVDAPGVLEPYTQSATNPSTGAVGQDLGPFCVLWDGSYPIQGMLGKTNGQYGFRVTAETNQEGASGNIQITAQRAYPAGATRDDPFTDPSCGGTVDSACYVLQKPITVNVTNVHVVVASATIVGAVGVYAEPYNLSYRLSKDASMYITINDPYTDDVVRTVVPGLPRVGEGTPNGTLSNGDSWNGRADNGDLIPGGVFLATLQAFSQDQFGGDLSYPTTVQVSLDPLQITDLTVAALGGGATSLANLGYTLTEPATVYIDIYPPNTQFCGSLTNVQANNDQPAVGAPPKNFVPYIGGTCSGGTGIGGTAAPLIRHFEQLQLGRIPMRTVWDGTDMNGNEECTDGDYVFVIYASLPSQNGAPFNSNMQDRRIWTSKAQTGFIPVLRGNVGLSQVAPSPTVIGSSPAISGLNPFVFRYFLGRDAITNMSIFDNTGTNLVRTLTSNAVRPGLFANQEIWGDAVNNSGLWVSSGIYIVQLTAADPLCPMKVSTVSASFPVNLFRITDVNTTPLMSGTSDTASLSYQLSQAMNITWNIYPPGTVILNSTSTWPPCGLGTGICPNTVNSQGTPIGPIRSFQGSRPGRMRITEYWDGRDPNGLTVPDGSYVFTLAAQSSTTPQYYAADQVFGSLAVSRGSIIFTSFDVKPFVPPLFNSSATITLDPFSIDYALTRQSSVTIQILNNNVTNQVVRTVVSGGVRDGGVLLEDLWDGRDNNNNFPPAGFYLVRAVALDVSSQLPSPSTAQMTIAYDPLRIYDVAIAPLTNGSGGARILYQVSETMKTAVKIYRPGTSFDGNGNPSPPEAVSLVKRIVGVRPARTQITETWDGTDLNLGVAPDGNYKFSIVGSTDMNAIDNITGDVLAPVELAEDRPLDDVAVVRNQSASPQGDFEGSTYIYPNPVDGDSANFVIFSPFQADVKLSIYTMSGELVLALDFGQQQANNYVSGGSTCGGITCYTWPRSNSAGRRVARGVYYAVIREEATDGSRNLLQTVKKFLVR